MPNIEEMSGTQMIWYQSSFIFCSYRVAIDDEGLGGRPNGHWHRLKDRSRPVVRNYASQDL